MDLQEKQASNITAIVAGTGTLPLEACRSLKAKGEPFFVISLFPEENSEQLQGVANEVVKKAFYKPSEILQILKDRNSTRVLLIGKVDKRNLLKKIKFDWMALKFLKGLFSKSDKSLMDKVLLEFETHGIEVIRQNDVLDTLMVPPGVLCGKVDENLQKDIDLGIEVALKISECDIGQTVVMKDGMILAIEAIEGTDNCIQRGIQLGGSGVTICKGARINQNKKYDLPTLGPDTLKNIPSGTVSAIAWQSSQTFIANKEKFIELAKEKGITLVSI